MIVKNETAVLGRLFESVAPYIDYYVIVDTGSSDGTQAFIKEWMGTAGIEGEVHDRAWVDFGHNRQQALDLAVKADRANWLLFIDADEQLVVEDPEFYESLEPGVTYRINKRHSGIVYALPQLVDVRQTRWVWRYPVHEALIQKGGSEKRADLPAVWIRYFEGEGARSHGVSAEQKFLRDARLLENYLAEHPASARCQFYLAQSYRDAGKLQKAYKAYRKRAAMGGWEEETFMAKFEMGRAAEQLNMSEQDVVGAYLAAFEFRPGRAEPLHNLASYFRRKASYNQAYLFARAASDLPMPPDQLFVPPAVYHWKALDELAVAAYWVGRPGESEAACRELLKRATNGVDIPAPDLERIRKNLDYAVGKIIDLPPIR